MLHYDRLELKRILSDIGDPKLIDQIIIAGYVSDEDLPAIYTLSKIFLFPSLREGFGIPILEAMACGVPVITSNTSSMPEVSGDAAHIVDPYNPHEITMAIIKILTEKKYWNTLSEKGLVQHKKFSWKIMAEQVLTIYNEIYKNLNQ